MEEVLESRGVFGVPDRKPEGTLGSEVFSYPLYNYPPESGGAFVRLVRHAVSLE